MKLRLPKLFVCASVVAMSLVEVMPAGAASAWPDAYSRRDYQLGMTLSAFKTTPFPDQQEWPGAFPVCSDDPRVESNYQLKDVQLTDAWSKAGVLKCRFFYNSKYSEYSGAGVVLGDINSRTEFYFYPPEPGAEPVLFQITSLGPSSKFSEIVGLYGEVLGPPTKVSTKQVQNRLGAVFSNQIVEYHNAQQAEQGREDPHQVESQKAVERNKFVKSDGTLYIDACALMSTS